MTMCYGGPLDGQFAPFPQMLAFPWPQGWYYYNPGTYPDTPSTYVWRDQPGTFTAQDIEWLKKHAP